MRSFSSFELHPFQLFITNDAGSVGGVIKSLQLAKTQIKPFTYVKTSEKISIYCWPTVK